MNIASLISGIAFFGLAFHPPVHAQDVAKTAREEQCSGVVFAQKEVSMKARITDIPLPDYSEEARRNGVSGAVVLSAVLCHSGQVTDIQVIKGLPHGVTEACVEAVRRIKFDPAEKDGEKVSVRLRIEHRLNVL